MHAYELRHVSLRLAAAAVLLATLLIPLVLPSPVGAGTQPLFKAPWECGKTMNAASRGGHIPAIDFHGFGTEWDPDDIRPIGDDERGAPVLAMGNGEASTGFGAAAGHTVTIDHGNGWATVYLHLEAEGVSGSVTQGQVIGTIGDSGNAVGAHLHVNVTRDGIPVPIRFDGALVPYGNTDTDGPADAKFPAFVSTNCDGTPPPNSVTAVHTANTHSSSFDDTVIFSSVGTAVGAGDFDGDGKTDLANRTANIFEVAPANGDDRFSISYGRRDDQLFVGDWDCDGIDTLAVRRKNVFLLKNTFSSGNADVVLAYGRAADEVFVGDWNQDGCDTFAVRRGNDFYVRFTNSTGVADIVFKFGSAADAVFVGDWNADGIDSFAVRRGTTMFISNALSTGVAEFDYEFGEPSDGIVVGDWDGDGEDTFGAVRVVTQ